MKWLFIAIVGLIPFHYFTLAQKSIHTPKESNPFGSSLKKYEKKLPNSIDKKRNEDKSDKDEVIQVKTELVINDILVKDTDGNIVSNLSKNDFVITEDGESQIIETFAVGENSNIPRSIVLIVDNSISRGFLFKSNISAAKVLIDKLNPNDKIAIVTTDVELLTNFTQDKILLKNILDKFENDSLKYGTSIEFDPLLAVLNEMFTVEDKQPIIIFQGSGNGIIWVKTDKDSPTNTSNLTETMNSIMTTPQNRFLRNYGFSDVKNSIENSRATIYPIILGDKFIGLAKNEQLKLARNYLQYYYATYKTQESVLKNNYEKDRQFIIKFFEDDIVKINIAGQKAMSRIAELSGGSINYLEKPEDAENIYSKIFKEISNKYSISYYSTNQSQERSRRTVKIEVLNHPEYQIAGRKTYISNPD